MKICLLFLAIFLSLQCFSQNTATFSELQNVNQYWPQQDDVRLEELPAYTTKTYREWILTHLQQVERILRSRPVSHLNASQLTNRTQALIHLHNYWQARAFPVNDLRDYKTPIFIDRYENFCAVGYLLKASGYESIARKIQQENNFAYVSQMNYPELDRWAVDFGFTKEELMWIQPTYGPPAEQLVIVKNGVNGYVNDLLADTTEMAMYVAGRFDTADLDVAASNIAYFRFMDDTTFTWHNMGHGLTGEVRCLEKYGDHLYAGGTIAYSGATEMNNIAYWDGEEWLSAGCLNGQVNDMVVYQDRLFALGSFTSCTDGDSFSLARYDGTNWMPVYGISGTITTAIVYDSAVFLGGTMYKNDTFATVVKWRPEEGFVLTDFDEIVTKIDAFGEHEGCLVASGTYLDSTLERDQGFIAVYHKDTGWKVGISSWSGFSSGSAVVTDFEALDGNFYCSGDFEPDPFSFPANMAQVYFSPGDAPECNLNATETEYYLPNLVLTMASMGQSLYTGGTFQRGIGKLYNNPNPPNSIATTDGTLDKLELFPNPVSQGLLHVQHDDYLLHYEVKDLASRSLIRKDVNDKQLIIDVSGLPVGMYFIHFIDRKKQSGVGKIVIR